MHHIYTLSAPSHPLSLVWMVLEWEKGTAFASKAAETAASCVDTPNVSQLKHLTVRVAIKRCAQADVLL